ncbi:hypothetical protein PoB_001444200 [Plakobranchus ocellatus]|uniref:Uncharacterized protein n=1 Tax=Plakobranchus ocellatus TaxID=259542 RepID=A0AAV3Z0C8_9GAST|nr:hypothetical protein PoB_001444200 [Plakobranchus ocellatus]
MLGHQHKCWSPVALMMSNVASSNRWSLDVFGTDYNIAPDKTRRAGENSSSHLENQQSGSTTNCQMNSSTPSDLFVEIIRP